MEDQAVAVTTALAAKIISNYVAHNTISMEQLPDLIRTVYQALNGLGQEELASEPETAKLTAAQIRKSIRPEALISFIDGKAYKTLKRHLATHGLTIADYKGRYGLARDYPSTAADYSAKRSEMAKSLGLGRQTAAPPAPPEAPIAKAATRRAPKKAKATPAA